MTPSESHVMNALASLAIARQAAEFDDAAQLVYVHLLRDIRPDWVIRACEALAKRVRLEFDPQMPSAGDIRREAHRLDRKDWEHEQERRWADTKYLPYQQVSHWSPQRWNDAIADALDTWRERPITNTTTYAPAFSWTIRRSGH